MKHEPEANVTARETVITERIRVDLSRRQGAASVMNQLLALLAKQERGWQITAVEIEVTKGVAEYSGHGTVPRRRAKPSEFK